MLGTGLVTLMLLLLTESGFATTNSLTSTTNTLLRQSPPWASRVQARASLNPALLEAWNTNATSLTAGRTAPQARQNLVLNEVGPNHRSWKREPDASAPAATNRFAQAHASAGAQVVEIATGMNYWDGEKYSPSDASFELTEDAFVADRVQHRTRLNADLNVIGAVTTSLVDGTTLRSTPVALALYSPDDGRFAVISTVTNSVGVLVASNRVVYPEAFSGGVCADVVYTLQKGSFEQDVVITGRLDPRDYGFPTNAQIQVITEFYDAPQPEKLRRPLYVEPNETVRRRKVSPDLMDEVLGFSELVIGTGRAYTPASAAHPNGTQAVVAKEFRTIPEEGRTFLIETVNCLSLQAALDALPECGRESGAAQRIRDSRAWDGYAFIPKPTPTAQANAKPLKSSSLLATAGSSPAAFAEPLTRVAEAATGVAERRSGTGFGPEPSRDGRITADRPPKSYQRGKPATDRRSTGEESEAQVGGLVEISASPAQSPALLAAIPHGVVIDYIAELGGTMTGVIVFQGDTTYLVADNVYCNGPVIIEGCAVFKYKAGTTIKLNGSLICRTSSYRPATFTALDDNSIGEKLSFDLDYTGVIDPDGYANPALWAYWLSGPNLSNLRICYAQEAIRLEGSYVTATLAHAQLVNCIRAVNLVSVVVSSGSSGAGVYLTVNNALLANVGWALTQSYSTGSGSGGSATFNHCTVAQADVLISTAQSFPNSFKNSIFANVTNVTSLGAPTPTGSYNGFYPETQGSFGNYKTISNNDPFQTSGGGAFYLKADSDFREKGTTAGLPAVLLTALKSKATQPPIEFPRFMVLSGELTLFPQTPRYVSGPPDLGFWYDALDFTVANMILDGGSITVQPGTAIAVRNDSYIWYDEFEDPWPAFTSRGFVLLDGASFNSQGTPQAPNTFTTVELVQDGTPSPYGAPFGKWPWIPCRAELFTVAGFDPEPNLSFRFSNFSVPPTWCYHFISGYDGRPQYVSWINTSSLGLILRDCNLAAGELDLGYATYDPNTFEQYPGVAYLNWQNTLFDRVYINLHPASQPASPSVDFAFEARNNLFRGGQLRLAPVVSSSGNWVFKDNIFDKVPFVQDTTEPLDHDYNGYWKRLPGELEWWQADRLSPDGANDRVLTSAPVYYAGPLGSYYRAPSGPLFQTGSRTAAEAGLAQYTIQPNQTKNNAGSPVSIGLHYVATISYSSAQPKDTDGDGLPDYIEDADGDGQWDEGLETKINATHTETAVHDSVNPIYDDADLDGDGMVGRIEKALGTDPLTPDNPLTVVQVMEEEPGIFSFKVPVSHALLVSIGGVNLNVDGAAATLDDLAASGDGKCLLLWNTTFDRPGQRFLQPQLGLLNPGSDEAILLAAGPIHPFYSDNVLQFFEAGSMFDDAGAYLDAELPVWNATYTIDLYDPSTTPSTLIRTIGPNTTSSGMIQEDWNVTYANESPFTGDTVEAVFDVTLLDESAAPIASGTSTKILTRATGALTEWGPDFIFAYMFTPHTGVPYYGSLVTAFAKNGVVWNGMQGVVDALIAPRWTWDVYGSAFNRYLPDSCGEYPGYVTRRSPPPTPSCVWTEISIEGNLLPALASGSTNSFTAMRMETPPVHGLTMQPVTFTSPLPKWPIC